MLKVVDWSDRFGGDPGHASHSIQSLNILNVHYLITQVSEIFAIKIFLMRTLSHTTHRNAQGYCRN